MAKISRDLIHNPSDKRMTAPVYYYYAVSYIIRMIATKILQNTFPFQAFFSVPDLINFHYENELILTGMEGVMGSRTLLTETPIKR